MICENCGKEHDGSYGSGRFCCKECARSFATKNKNNKELKEAKCIDCGKIIYIKKNVSKKTCRCSDCFKKHQIENNHTRVFTCSVCGRKYVKGDKCPNDFCHRHTIRQLNTFVKYFGFDKAKLGTLNAENEFYRIKNEIYNLYIKNHLSSREICEIYNYPYVFNFSNKILKYLEIKPKTCSEATKENFEYNRMTIPYIKNQYHSEWHNTWDGKEVYLRSSFESDYANELDKQQIKYEVESLRIKYFNSEFQEYKCAIPDFYLPETNTIVEIKSNWTLNIQEMKDKVKSYKELGYNFKLILEHKNIDINNL